MSNPRRLCLVGATGLIGTAVIRESVGRNDVRIVGVARREANLPVGARLEMLLADPANWRDAIAASGANVLACALGTTWRKAGKDEAAFRAVDFDLVMHVAYAAKEVGVDHLILVSSAGADLASKQFYLRVKGETEIAVNKVGFKRLDILRPGLLRGQRVDDPRFGERLAMLASPVADHLMFGRFRNYRSISAADVAQTILALTHERTAGRYVHDNDGMAYVRRRFGDKISR